MKMEIIQILILIFSTFALSRVFINIKNKTIGALEAIFWLIFWAAVILATALPNLIEKFANIFGVGRGVDLAVYGTIILLSYMIFRLYAKLENTEKKITKIVRTIAIKK
jgi:small membrane protein